MKKIFILLLFPLYIFSQSSISGNITDIDGNPIMGANVIAVNNETKVLDGFGISNERLTPPIKKLNNGKIKIKPIEIQRTGNCFP